MPTSFKEKKDKNWEITISYVWYTKKWKLHCDTIYNPEDDKVYIASVLTQIDSLDYNDKKIIEKYFYWLEKIVYNTLNKLGKLF